MKSLSRLSRRQSARRHLLVFALGIIITCAGLVPAAGQPYVSGFKYQWQNRIPQGNLLNDVGGADGEYFAVAGTGTVIHDDGSGWYVMETGTVATLIGVWAASADDVFTVGSGGVIIHWNGYSWTSMTSGTAYTLNAVWGSATDDVFAVGNNGKILHFDGLAWSSMTSGTSTQLRDVWGSAGDDVFAVGSGGTILHYDGAAWSVVTSPTTSTLNSVWCASVDDAWAVGEDGVMVHYDGVSWTIVKRQVYTHLRSLWGTASDNIYAVGDMDGSTGAIKILHYNGTSWTVQTAGSGRNFVGLWGESAADIVGVGNAGAIYRFDGVVWTWESSGAVEDLNSLCVIAEDDAFAVGNSGLILHWNGLEWQQMESGTALDLFSVWGTDFRMYAVGRSATFLRYNGVSWSPVPHSEIGGFYGIWGFDWNDAYIAAAWGRVFHFDGGSLTEMLDLGGGGDFIDAWGASPSDLWACGGQGLWHYDGVSWIEQTLPPHSGAVRGLWGFSSSDVYAVSREEVLHHDGATWTIIHSGADYAFNDIWGPAPDQLFFVAGSGVSLFFNGSSFHPLRPVTAYPLESVHGTSASDVFAVGDVGTILHSDEAPVAVLIRRFFVEAKTGGIEVRWEIFADEEVAGFRLYRRDLGIGSETVLNGGNLIEPSARRYFDSDIQPGSAYRYHLAAVLTDGSEVRSYPLEVKTDMAPMALYANYPNPFNPTTRISFSLPDERDVVLEVFDINGRHVRTLVDRKITGGVHHVDWDGCDSARRHVASGVYFYRIKAGDFTRARKMVLLR